MRKEEFCIGNYTKTSSMTKETRASLIQLVEKLVEIKNYRMDTLFLSVNLLDRFLASMKPETKKLCLGSLSICCLLLAVKLEEPIQPSFNNMCRLLKQLQIVAITKSTIISLESQVLLHIDFTVRTVSSINFLERYLRLYGMDQGEID